MMTPVLNERLSDSDLWQFVRQGSAEAFEVLVGRHQALVSAVAYNACGNLALSEDVAQETFWAAWHARASLVQPGRLRPWLCGIARNLGKNAGRRSARPVESASALDAVTEPPSDAPGPTEEAMSREEESLVWRELGRIPESYREPLILFYRENQSVAEVADALGLSEDAVKQRLARGRGMLRERVAEMVEGGLRRSRPGRGFTVAVMAGLTAGSAGAKTAAAAGAGAGATSSAVAVAKAAAGAGVAGGVLGGVLGSVIGLAGGWLGTWIPAQVAATKGERDYLLRAGRRILLISVVFMAVLFGLVEAFAGRPAYIIAWGSWMIAFEAYVAVECVRLARGVKRIRAEAGPSAEPNDSALHAGMSAIANRYRGRVFRSRATLLGLPLIDINVSDPALSGGTTRPDSPGLGRRVARGWIAIGDDARGILLAIGSKAIGLVAMGGRSVGVLSFGGLAVGLLAVGGLSLGVVAIGGLGLGVYAIGGLGLGWQAAGGAAIAWDAACGGFAAARHAAYGGFAIAHDYAVGGGGWARHFNDDAARALFLGHPLRRGVEWYLANVAWLTTGVVLLSLLPIGLIPPLMYRRDRGR